jgi:hypothetical protein
MAPPSYARSTASSTSKASPNASNTTRIIEESMISSLKGTRISKTPKLVNSAPSTPKKPLKRPSLLTPKARDQLTYNRDLYTIKPKNASKLCLLSDLPSELRSLIYTFVLPSIHHISDSWPAILKRGQRRLPPLLHICRAIRIEAAYDYYINTTFSFTVRNLNFDPVMRWIDELPKQHRALLLSRNRHLEMNILPSVKNTFTYPPKGWLIDGYMQDHWKACQPFGNIYTVPSDLHKSHFLVFCRLASWFFWCSRSPHKPVIWNYTFEQSPFHNPFGLPGLQEQAVLEWFLKHHAGVLTMGCVEKAWKRNTSGAAVMRAEVTRLLGALNQWYRERWVKDEDGGEWEEVMEALKKGIEKW